MTAFRAPALDKAAPIVDPATGRITPYMQRFWQNLSFTADTGANQGSDISALTADIVSINSQLALKVVKNLSTGWTAATGTADKTAFATYTSPTISASPTQAQVQAIADHVQILSQHVKALIDGLFTASVIHS